MWEIDLPMTGRSIQAWLLLKAVLLECSDKAGALAGGTNGADFFEGYASDPQVGELDGNAAESSWSVRLPSVMEQLRHRALPLGDVAVHARAPRKACAV